MNGKSESTQSQQSTTNPWATATPQLEGILGQVGQGLNNTGLTGTEQGALGQLQQNAGSASQFAPQIQSYASNLLGGGGATAQAGNLQGGLDQYRQQLSPFADPNYSSLNNPALQSALQQVSTDATNQINGSFAGAGRDFSGANQMALGRGIAAAQAPLILNQFNQDRQTQQGAAGALYGAQNQTGGLLSGLNQQGLANQGQGVGASQDAFTAQNAGANATLQAEAARRGIPVQALGLLAQIGIPIAGLGSQSTGQSQGTQQMSGAQQFGMIANGVSNLAGSLFGGGGAGGSGAVANAKMISDRRAKEDIKQVGTLFDGTPVYRYRYIGEPAFQIGLMAQDIEKVTPEAVGMIGQYKAVDYKLATDKALEVA